MSTKTQSMALIDEEPILFLPMLACAIGVNEAIFLQQLHYWLKINGKAKRNKKDGEYWMYNSLEGWREQFPFWSVKTIQRIISKLKSQKLIVTGNYNKLSLDRTIWYRIDYKMLATLVSELVSGIGVVKLSKSIRSKCPNRKPRFHLVGSHGITGRQIDATYSLAAKTNKDKKQNGMANVQG